MLQRQESLTDPIAAETRTGVLETAPVSALSPRLQALQTRKRGLEADEKAESARKKTRQDAAELFKDLTTASRKIDTDIPEGMITDKAEYDRLLPGLQAEYRRIVTESPESTLYSLLEHLGQKEFALLEFGPERIALWLSNNHTIRSIWEHSEPTEQCRSGAGGEEGQCWICGMAIDPEATHEGYDQGAPECEHILPIVNAVQVLSLYSEHAVTTGVISKAEQNKYSLEYAWAHSHCNQLKSDDIYLKSVNPETVAPDPRKWDALLTKIISNPRGGKFKEASEEFVRKLNAYIARYPSGMGKWREDRRKVFMEKYGKITDHINNEIRRTGLATFVLQVAVASKTLSGRITEPAKRQMLGLPARGGKRRKTRRHRLPKLL
uniref:Uncharacterized protein n=1 Tax=viral metagenome TaxID=1070528 RepID=A0A6C0ELL5_9ZZZZ